jgi:arginine/ornithine transport system permease protein
VWLFTYVVRGTPLLVQLFLVYYGLAQFEAVRESVAWPLLREAWFCAWLAFAINTTAYTTEMFAGTLRATPAGEV